MGNFRDAGGGKIHRTAIAIERTQMIAHQPRYPIPAVRLQDFRTDNPMAIEKWGCLGELTAQAVVIHPQGNKCQRSDRAKSHPDPTNPHSLR